MVNVSETLQNGDKYQYNAITRLQKKKNIVLPVGESNPGLPRDRRGYLPLY